MDSPLPASRSAVPRTGELTTTAPSPQPYSRHPLWALSTNNNRNSSAPSGPAGSLGGAILWGRRVPGPGAAARLEDRRDGKGWPRGQGGARLASWAGSVAHQALNCFALIGWPELCIAPSSSQSPADVEEVGRVCGGLQRFDISLEAD